MAWSVTIHRTIERKVLTQFVSINAIGNADSSKSGEDSLPVGIDRGHFFSDPGSVDLSRPVVLPKEEGFLTPFGRNQRNRPLPNFLLVFVN